MRCAVARRTSGYHAESQVQRQNFNQGGIFQPRFSGRAKRSMRSGMKPQKVLIVDDDSVVLFVVQAWLQSAGFEVLTHDSPFGTASLIRRERPAILLLDMQ